MTTTARTSPSDPPTHHSPVVRERGGAFRVKTMLNDHIVIDCLIVCAVLAVLYLFVE